MTDKNFYRMMDAFVIAAAHEYSLALLNASLVCSKRDYDSAERLASLANFILRKEEYNGCVAARDFLKSDDDYADAAIEHMKKYNLISSVAPDEKQAIESFAKWSHFENHGMLMQYAQWIASIAKASTLVGEDIISKEEFDEWIESSTRQESVFRLRKKATAKSFKKMRTKLEEIKNKVHNRQKLKTA